MTASMAAKLNNHPDSSQPNPLFNSTSPPVQVSPANQLRIRKDVYIVPAIVDADAK